MTDKENSEENSSKKSKEKNKDNSKEKTSKEKKRNTEKQESSEDSKKESKKEETQNLPIQSRTKTLKPIEISKSSLEKTIQEQPSQGLEKSLPISSQESNEEDEIKYMNVKKYNEFTKDYQSLNNQENISSNVNPFVTSQERLNLEKDIRGNNFQSINPIKAPEIQDSSVSEDYVVGLKSFDDSKKDIRNTTDDFLLEKKDKGYEYEIKR